MRKRRETERGKRERVCVKKERKIEREKYRKKEREGVCIRGEKER